MRLKDRENGAVANELTGSILFFFQEQRTEAHFWSFFARLRVKKAPGGVAFCDLWA
jgi:hypothetical protein